MSWLLPAATLLQLISSAVTPARAWGEKIDVGNFRTSVISIALARVTIQMQNDPVTRMRLESDLDALTAQIHADSGLAPYSFSGEHARLWGRICLDSTIAAVSQLDRQVYATAMFEGFTVVEPHRSEHEELQALGVRIHAI